MSNGLRVAVLASGDRASGGGGSTAEKVIRDTLEDRVDFSIPVVICNNPPGTVGVYPKVEALNEEFGLRGGRKIDVVHIGPQNYPDGKLPRGQTLSESAAIVRLLEQRGIDFVSMLGYLRILNGELIQEWGWQPEYAMEPLGGIYHPRARIINNHPGRLPLTADTHGHGTHALSKDLYDAGTIHYTAMSWHLGAAAVDAGPLIAEHAVEILPHYTVDDISDAVQAAEKQHTAPVIDAHLLLRQQHLGLAV